MLEQGARATFSSRTSCSLLGQQRPQLLDGSAQVASRPQHGGIQHQREHAELVLLSRPVRLQDLPALAVADVPGELVAGLLNEW
ncbi:hypothetical protein SAFG77S_12236 [Streptomyces afghaniensis]